MSGEERLKTNLKKYIANFEIAILYFDLMKEVVDITRVKTTDDRIAMTTPSNGKVISRFNINRLPVVELQAYQNKPYIGFLVRSHRKTLPLLRDNKNLVFGDTEFANGTTTLFANYQKPLQLREEFKAWHDHWIDVVRDQLTSATKTPYRRYHNEILYKVVTDLDYRQKFLKEIYPTHK